MAWLCIGTATGIEVRKDSDLMGHYNYLEKPYCAICSSPGLDTINCILKCATESAKTYGFNRTYALGKYLSQDQMQDDLLSKHIVYLKQKWGEQYSEPLGSALFLFVREKFPELFKADLVVPVPAHRNALERRQFNQTEKIADWYCDYSGQEILLCLEKLKESGFAKDKINLSRRYELVKGMFRLKSSSFEKHIKGKNIILLDDVATSCAQSSECSQVLRNHGARKVDVLTLGRNALDGAI